MRNLAHVSSRAEPPQPLPAYRSGYRGIPGAGIFLPQHGSIIPLNSG